MMSLHMSLLNALLAGIYSGPVYDPQEQILKKTLQLILHPLQKQKIHVVPYLILSFFPTPAPFPDHPQNHNARH